MKLQERQAIALGGCRMGPQGKRHLPTPLQAVRKPAQNRCKVQALRGSENQSSEGHADI